MALTARDYLIRFLREEEGLKSSDDLMAQWVDNVRCYEPEHPHILIGPLKSNQYEYLKTVTFLVNPDQMGALVVGAQYNRLPDDPAPTAVPFGSGCMQLVTLFEDLSIPQAVLSASDIASRQYLPPDILGFTATKPMFEELCTLDESSFLYKKFWKRLKKSRKKRES